MNIKKVLSGVLAAAMVISLIPAAQADAASTVTNKAIGITFSNEADTDVTFAVMDESSKSEEYALSMDVYYPKSAVTEKASYTVSINLDVFAATGAGEYEGAAIGTAKVSNILSGGTSAAANTTVEEVGDYYCMKITSLPIKLTQYPGTIKKYADIPDTVLVFPEIKFSGKASAASKLYVDNLSIKGGSVTAYANNFDASQKESATEVVGKGSEVTLDPVKFAAGKLTVKSTKVTVKVKKKVSLGAVADPATKITYKSSNKKVATVNSKGVVKGIKKGKAKITITANGLKQVVTVTVK